MMKLLLFLNVELDTYLINFNCILNLLQIAQFVTQLVVIIYNKATVKDGLTI